VRAVELAIAAAFIVGGVRSVWTWSRRPFESGDVTDHVLYALWVTGRCGLWFAFAGFFLIYAANGAEGRAAIDAFTPFRWYLIVPISLAALQFVAGFLLGRRSPS
jgi:hypothetical protein